MPVTAAFRFGDLRFDDRAVVAVAAGGVRRGDDVGGAGSGGERQHAQAVVARPGAVVHAVEEVAVDVGEAVDPVA